MIVAHIPNLFDRSRFGAAVTFVDDPSALADLKPRAVIVDLDRCEDPSAFMVPGAEMIGFGPHVDTAGHQAASDLGYDRVLARSVFFRGLNEMLIDLNKKP